jgi:hypothetical protein
MGEVHKLILREGVEETRRIATSKIERQCIDAAFEVLSDEKNKIGITHAGFAMASLPISGPKKQYGSATAGR